MGTNEKKTIAGEVLGPTREGIVLLSEHETPIKMPFKYLWAHKIVLMSDLLVTTKYHNLSKDCK